MRVHVQWHARVRVHVRVHLRVRVHVRVRVCVRACAHTSTRPCSITKSTINMRVSNCIELAQAMQPCTQRRIR